MKRAVIFAHFDYDDIVDEYVYFYLKELQKISNYIVFVSTANLCKDHINILEEICTNVIVRKNIGYYFMSYKIGLESFDYAQYDEVIICNDSVFGPIYSLSNIFKEMNNKECDFWGITSGKEISFHLQSYFLVCKKKVLISSSFTSFWEDVKIIDDKRKIIEEYEIGFTKKLLSSGFLSAVYSNYKPTQLDKIVIKLKRVTVYKFFEKIILIIKGKNVFQNPLAVNITHQYWKELLVVSKMPFIKIELLRDNPINIDISEYKEVIQKISNYDVSLIEQHLYRVKN